jgi:CRP-like cAMP-binding protein
MSFPQRPGSAQVDLSKNKILAGLPVKESERLLPHLEHLDARIGQYFYNAGDPMSYVYFPQACVVSMLVTMENGVRVEVGMIGNDGVVGIGTLFGRKISSYGAVVQIPDGCLRMKADVLLAEFKRGGVLQERLLSYGSSFLSQVSQTAACNRVHPLRQRLCRWLLMSSSFATGNRFPITHEFLSHMLGAPRSEVTIAAGILRKAGYIRYVRGEVTILDRKGLEATACECYKVVRDELLLVSKASRLQNEIERLASKPITRPPNSNRAPRIAVDRDGLS